MSREKYACLEDHLRRVPSETREVSLTFAQIDAMLADAGQRPLPDSARRDRPWWANVKGEHNRVQSASWYSAGWKVGNVDFGIARVKFERL